LLFCGFFASDDREECLKIQLDSRPFHSSVKLWRVSIYRKVSLLFSTQMGEEAAKGSDLVSPFVDAKTCLELQTLSATTRGVSEEKRIKVRRLFKAIDVMSFSFRARIL
jgi:hypothetical protein